jgi:DNA phosphorothioation-associated putative methyltransferase
MSRRNLSRPVTRALDDGLIGAHRTFFDYGCGRGDDVRGLAALGVPSGGWDPAFAPTAAKEIADVVNLGYVINVIEDQPERQQTLSSAWALAKRVLIVSARPEWELRGQALSPHGDGWLTASGTFQKFYSQLELREFIARTLSEQPVAAAPGTFYVFRDARDAQAFAISRVREQRSHRVDLAGALYDGYRDQLEDLAAFFDSRGRLPVRTELGCADDLQAAFGSIERAFATLRRHEPADRWLVARQAAIDSLLVFVALSAFSGRARWSDLPDDLQRDVRQLIGSWKEATARGDRLLYAANDDAELARAIGSLKIGKVLPDAIYLHVSALAQSPPLLRVYEGCARALVGDVDGATILKLQRVNRRVAYMSYPRFDRDAHPKLEWSLRADLRTLDVRYRDFSASENPPILHRKDAFLAADDPNYKKFAGLTRQEERAGLLGRVDIGTVRGWNEVLAASGFTVHGHTLRRRPAVTDDRA